MTLLHEAVEQKKFDVRMIERNVNRGVVSATDAQKNAAALPDDAEFAEYVSLDSFWDEGASAQSSSSN